ncbi:hypothetical protein NX059_009666 [Plenodomus lindquistii]|nr:hypothetical protein NX059_009666 [Plenodomus lindquistii]
MLKPTYDKQKNDEIKKTLVEFVKIREDSSSGFDYDWLPQNTGDVSDEERSAQYDMLFGKGGGNFWFGNYKDLLFGQEANNKAHAFWRQKTLPRTKNSDKAKLLATEIAPHPFKTKRVSLGADYFEVCDQDNVKIISLHDIPIEEFVPNGITHLLSQYRIS